MSEDQPDIQKSEVDYASEVMRRHEGKEFTMPNYDVRDVRIIAARNPNDGSALVYEFEGYKEKAVGKEAFSQFKYATNFFKDREVEHYTKAELEKSCAEYEVGPEAQRQIVTLDQYNQGFKSIEASIYVTGGLEVREAALAMKSIMEDAESKVTDYKQGIAVQQESLDHQNYLMKDFSFKRALEPSMGMELEGGEYTETEYDVNDVAIEVTGDARGAVIHLMHPKEGKTGEMNDAFVYRTREEIDALREKEDGVPTGKFTGELSGGLITSNQLAADMVSKNLTFYQRQYARSRILEMGHNLRDDPNLEEGVDYKEYMKGLETQQALINSVNGMVDGGTLEQESGYGVSRTPGFEVGGQQ